jgi:hydroxymethylglutaryl-CoA synthase
MRAKIHRADTSPADMSAPMTQHDEANTRTRAAGIEALGVAFPTHYLDLGDLARARGVAPEKFADGLGVFRMAVPPVDEDTVTLAARAAKMALVSANASPDDIGLLAIGTETAVDHSKPVASYVQGLLGVSSRCRVFETKHACYGGTAALQLALDWIRSGSAQGRKALVVCSDIARYGIGTAGEPTQGAGAVALLLSDTPSVLAFDTGLVGVYAEDVMDFWRPLYSKDAFVDGHYSVECYLKALAGAYGAYVDAAGGRSPGEMFSERFAALAYHVPYGKMARKAHRTLRTLDGDETPDASFDRLVSASLVIPAEIGNTYTASLYFALASVLAHTNAPLAGKRVGLFSYGSGSCAEFFSGVVGPQAQSRVRDLGIPALLASRHRLSMPEYEALMHARENIDQKPLAETAGSIDFRYVGTRDHRRIYAR